MPHEALRRQLDQLNARLRLDPSNRWLTVELQLTAYTLARLEAQADEAEPLVDLLSKLGRGDITADTAGQAISRDLDLAAQVAGVAIGGGSTLDEVTFGDVAAGNIYHIYLGGPRDH
jgi:hypothetical protein